jgi:hypothetical protein
MIEIKITPAMVQKAKTKAAQMGALNNSIRQGDGNLVGFLGEQIAQQVLGATEKNSYHYDLVLPNGQTIDVKTKQTTVKPRVDYDCSVAAFNTKQQCDYYAFVRVKSDLTTGWYLGAYKKSEYFQNAVSLKKGQIDPSNNFTVKADCYNMKISDLQQI